MIMNISKGSCRQLFSNVRRGFVLGKKRQRKTLARKGKKRVIDPVSASQPTKNQLCVIYSHTMRHLTLLYVSFKQEQDKSNRVEP